MMAGIEAIVDEQIAAYERGDTAAFVACYEADAVCTELPSGRIMAQGHEEIAEVWGRLFARGPRKVEIASRIVEPPHLVDHEIVTVAATGRVVRAIAIYDVGPERIRRVWLPVAGGELADKS